jgi:hypothetical protein
MIDYREKFGILRWLLTCNLFPPSSPRSQRGVLVLVIYLAEIVRPDLPGITTGNRASPIRWCNACQRGSEENCGRDCYLDIASP